MVIESASDRILRILVLSIGIGSVVFTLLGLPSIIEQAPFLDPLYTFAVFGIYCVLPPVAGAMAFRAPTKVLRALGLVHAISGLVFIVTWPAAMLSDRLPDDEIPWLLNMITAAICFGGILLPPRFAWALLFLTAGFSGTVRYIVYGGGDASQAIQDAIMTVVISGVFMSLLQLAVKAGQDQDAAALAAQDAASHSAASATIESQRSRFHAFMHDDVLATLNGAARGGEATDELTRKHAAHALKKMDEFRDGTSRPQLLTVNEFESLLQASILDHDIQLRVSKPLYDLDVPLYPSAVSDAIAEAFAESVRNTIRHANWADGRPVKRTARVHFSEDEVTVIVKDDGRGFVAHRIALDRLGIRVSILNRVNSQQGGRATVFSAKGEGTTVTLSWLREGVEA